MKTLKALIHNSVTCFYASCILYLVSLLAFSLTVPRVNEFTAPIFKGVQAHHLFLLGISVVLLQGIVLTILNKLLTKK